MQTPRRINLLRNSLKRLAHAISPVIVACCLASQAQAQDIVKPVAATAESNYGPRPPVHAIDGSGMAPNNPVTASSTCATGTGDGTMWLSNNTKDTWITFDLGSVKTLSGFHLWNYNEVNLNNRGVKTAGIYVGTSMPANGSSYASQGPAWGTLAENFTFTQGPGAAGYLGEDYGFAAPVTGRYIQIYVTSGFPGADGNTGISEIRFYGPMTPKAKINIFGPGAIIGPVSGKAASISWMVPYGSNPATLLTTFNLSCGATCTVGGTPPVSGERRNFTSPVHYIVKASDFATSGTTIDYTVTVTVAPDESPPPDLTAAGAIAALKAGTLANANPFYRGTYNLGATGLRGWIHVGGGDAAFGTLTVESRQILVTVASTPGRAVLAVDDVILGAMAASSGTVPLFTSDARKSFGVAIGNAEKTGAGTLRVKRWRAGTTTDVNIPMTIMGDYTATAPYSCPKSERILANARTKLVSQLKADPNFLKAGWDSPISGLALLSAVVPGDPDYATVQSRLKTFARALAATPPNASGTVYIWDWGYTAVFLSEYYLRTVADGTPDTQVVTGLNNRIVALAKAQSRYGTYGHGGSLLKADGSLHGTIPPYGPVNSAGIPATIAIVLGKKALLAAGQAIDPEIDPAIQRGSDFFGWFVNKGSIPYGEHDPGEGHHASNGKDPMCAVLFGLQASRTMETEFFSRLSIAGFDAREMGHSGQGFSYLWGAMGANMGGKLALAEYTKQIRWHLDLERRSDGSFVYDGQLYGDDYRAGSTADGTYLGASDYFGMNPTASYILTYSLPLKRLHITGKNAIPANTLDATKVANAISAATIGRDSPGFTTTQLIASLSAFDPCVRNNCAIELVKRSLSGAELTTLRNMVTGTNANGRMGACQALGLLNDATALPLITQRLDKRVEPDSWVRAKAASAIRSYTPATASVHRDSMLTAFTANATDPEVIVWDDPLQFANNFLSSALFNGSFASYTINAPKNLLYPAVKAGLKQPDSRSRDTTAQFCYNFLPLPDVQALIPNLIEVVKTTGQADTMFSMYPRIWGVNTLAKWKISEGIPLTLELLEIPYGYGWNSGYLIDSGLVALASYGDAARWTLPTLEGYTKAYSGTNIIGTIDSIENAITAPTLIPGFAVANSQVVATTGAKAVTLTGSSPRGTALTFTNISVPAHGKLTGTPPNLTYTPASGFSGLDSFTFQTADHLTNSALGTVSIIVGGPGVGSGLKGEYYDNMDFSNLKLTRTDAQVNFDWGTASPNALLGADTFSVRWSGMLLVPETGSYTFSTLNGDGVRLYVNGVPMIDQSANQTTNWVYGSSVNLTAGKLVEIQMEYYQNTGSAVAKLKWTGPSLAGANGAIIPKEWLFDGAAFASRKPYAHAQSVSTVRKTPQPITLMGSGGSPLSYRILTKPSHGTLRGNAPYLTYTPAANYSGADSFTFAVKNGNVISTPATVTIDIKDGLPEEFTWQNAASGEGSNATNWTAGKTPATTGQPYYHLNFTPAGAYTVTHNLNNGFQLNQLNVAGAVTINGTNSLAFTSNGSTLPQVNQNGPSTVTVNHPIALEAMTRVGGSGRGAISLTGTISGSGGIIKNGIGQLTINQDNTYTGGTIINAGNLEMHKNSALGSGPVTLNGGTLIIGSLSASNSLIVNGGTLYSIGGWGGHWSGLVTLNSDLSVAVNHWMAAALNGNISGAGGLIVESYLGKSLNGSGVTLGGINTYTGTTKIKSDARLTCGSSAALGSGQLDISSGGVIGLNFVGTKNITTLTLGGVPQTVLGTYGSTASPATYKNDTYFSGTGTVSVGVSSTAVVASSQSVSTAKNTQKTITLSTTAGTGKSLSYSIVKPPAHGVLIGTAPHVTYAPFLHYNGPDSFTFKINDGNVDSAPAKVTITVTPD